MKSFAIFSIFFISISLTACATSPSPTQDDIADKSVEDVVEYFDHSENKVSFASQMLHKIGIGKPPLEKTTDVNLKIFTAKNLNAGNEKEPLSLVLKTYLLTSPEKFFELPYSTFLDDEATEEALGDTLVMQREAVLTPDKLYDNTPTFPAEARYVGFIALFRHPAPQRWRFAYNVRSSAKKGITLGVHRCSLSSTSGLLINSFYTPANFIANDQCAKTSPLSLQQRLKLGR